MEAGEKKVKGERGSSRSVEGSDCHLYQVPTVCQAMGSAPVSPGSSHADLTPALCQSYYPALTEKETETEELCNLPKVTQLVRSGARIPAQVCLPPVHSPCCQKVLLLEKQVWGWGFQSERIRIPRGKSIVICAPPPHPSARQVAGEPPTTAPAPAPGASSALPGSPPLPGAPKVALRSSHTPKPSILRF